jgi:hypothetical protein
LALLDEGLKDIFITVSNDIIDSFPEKATESQRSKLLREIIKRWDDFFKRNRKKGMGEEAQRGLFAELWWLDVMLKNEITAYKAVISWKGPLGRFHDFDVDGKKVEVKSTIQKIPRNITISNEVQLDDKGTTSLHLFVLTLDHSDSGLSLPKMIEKLRTRLKSSTMATRRLNTNLILAGYSDVDAEKYSQGYSSRKEELFEVKEGFPRIIKLPNGTGNLKYSVSVDSCQTFLKQKEDYFK